VRTIVQRVREASVEVDGELVGAIGVGLVAYVGVEPGDDEPDVRTTCRKLAELRVFPGKTPMDLDVREVGGAVLAISQFTLLASVRRGRRPSFDGAERPDRARLLYERLCDELRSLGLVVAQGRFAAHMIVRQTGDGPVTIPIATRGGTLL
jgi:D-tyrosyl-tRNA(Tyr) deacylase